MAAKDDHLLNWISFAIAGWLSEGNIYLLDYCISRLPTDDLPIVEIGSFSGLSTNVMRRIADMRGRKNRIISVDPWAFEGADAGKLPNSAISFEDYRAFIIENFKRNTTLFSGHALPIHVPEFSFRFFELWRQGAEIEDLFGRRVTLGGPIGFVYIDGSHAYGDALRDFQDADNHLAVGGYIVFDDSADGTEWGSHKVAVEAAAHPRYRLVDKAPNYCVQKIA